MNLKTLNSKSPFRDVSSQAKQGSGQNPTALAGRWAAFYAIFKFFASLKLAIFVLLSLIAVFAAGTFIESLYSTETATLVIYQAWWFNLLLLLLGVNVTAAALDRLPWQKKHTGFVITHLGIILVLIGSFVTKYWMVDGQMAIEEGKTEFRITLPDPVFSVFLQEKNREWTALFRKKPFEWKGNQVLIPSSAKMFPFQVRLLNYLPKARIQKSIRPAASGTPAVEITLKNSFLNQTQWLIAKDPEQSDIQMGPARILMADELLPERASQPEISEAGYLEFHFDKITAAVPLKTDLQLPVSFELENTPYRVTVLRILKNGQIIGKTLIDDTDGASADNAWENPAVEILLEGEGLNEKHTIFSKFPDFPTMHGMKPSAAGAKIYYRMPGGGSRGKTHELRFVVKDEELYYQIVTGLDIRTGKIKEGEEQQTGWMDLVFRLETFYPKAENYQEFLPEPVSSKNEQAVAAIQVEIEKEDGRHLAWLAQGTPEKIMLAGQEYYLLFGQKRIPAGFRLELKDFRLETYPGTNNPASYESDVMLRDDSRGIQREVTISMNQPLEYQGYKIYQSGYSQAPGSPDVSVFAVGRDPGIFLKYLGAIVLVSGMIIMFSMRKFSSIPEKIL